MKLPYWWTAGPYLYQFWETPEGITCECVDVDTLVTLFRGEGDDLPEAIREALRDSLRRQP